MWEYFSWQIVKRFWGINMYTLLVLKHFIEYSIYNKISI